jgi:hypothetical protein
MTSSVSPRIFHIPKPSLAKVCAGIRTRPCLRHNVLEDTPLLPLVEYVNSQSPLL